MERPVATIPRQPAFTTVHSDAARSNPAESGDPRTGTEAVELSFFTRSRDRDDRELKIATAGNEMLFAEFAAVASPTLLLPVVLDMRSDEEITVMVEEIKVWIVRDLVCLLLMVL